VDSERKKSTGARRVTDATGEEYLCPVSKLSDSNFVSEEEKRNCLDYNFVSEHRAS